MILDHNLKLIRVRYENKENTLKGLELLLLKNILKLFEAFQDMIRNTGLEPDRLGSNLTLPLISYWMLNNLISKTLFP